MEQFNIKCAHATENTFVVPLFTSPRSGCKKLFICISNYSSIDVSGAYSTEASLCAFNIMNYFTQGQS
jgi:hypothetical protein